MQVLLRALRDFNLGKLTADDTSIFMGLLNDLFPKTVELVPRAIDHEFEGKVCSLSGGLKPHAILPIPVLAHSCPYVWYALCQNARHTISQNVLLLDQVAQSLCRG